MSDLKQAILDTTQSVQDRLQRAYGDAACGDPEGAQRNVELAQEKLRRLHGEFFVDHLRQRGYPGGTA